MPQKLIQTQREEQVQQLSAIQIAVAKMLELPVMDFGERVRNEMDDNVALEESGNDAPDESMDDFDNTDIDLDSNTSDTQFDNDRADYLTEDDVPDYLLRQNNGAEAREIQISDSSSSYDDLLRQVSERDLTDEERQAMEYIIGSLDADGYLRKSAYTIADELAIYQGIDLDSDTIKRLIDILHTFDPRGIGAASLQECLALQISDPDMQSPYKEVALQIVKRCFNDFATRRWDVIKRRLHIDEDTLQAAVRLLLRLNPKPGSGLNETATAAAPTVVPDFYVSIGSDGLPVVHLNNGDIPELRVSQAFKETLREYGAHREKLTKQQQDEYVYIRKKVGDAQLFIEIIHRRRHTLLSVMRSIVSHQQDFFINDDDESLLKPLTLKEVASSAGVDISTVSRVTNSKYVQTDYGVYPLRHFFSSQFTTQDGEEMSSRQARAALAKVVEEEDKSHPLSDEAIAAILKERGVPISRRTVVKYRDMLGIPSSRLRKR